MYTRLRSRPKRPLPCRWKRPCTRTRMVARTSPIPPGKGWLTPHQYAVGPYAPAISHPGLTMSSPTPPREMRLTMRVLGHWREICGDREFPARAEVTAERLGADWSHCLLIAVDAEPERSSFLYVGPTLVVPDGPALVGAPVAACSRETILGLAT